MTTGAFIESRVPEWHALCQSLIRQRSVFEQECGVVEIVAGWISALGLDVTRVAHDAGRLQSLAGAQGPISRVPGRSSLVARVRGRGAGRSLVFNTHLDIVPEGDHRRWSHPPFEGHIDRQRGVIHGRGAMDDKAGVTIALAVLETLVRGDIRPAGDVLFHFVLEDETTGNGTLLCLADGHRADAAVIIDGTRPDRAIALHAGQLQFDIDVAGLAASVSVSHMGVNAAEMLARFAVRLADRVMALNETRGDPWTRFPSPFQIVVQRLDAEGAQLTVPDRATATCYMTFPPPWTVARAQEWLQQESREFARERDLAQAPALRWNGFIAEPVAASSRPLCALLTRCAEQEGYGPVDVGPSTGTSDMRHFVAAGIPCVLYGPGNGFGPHRADEYYELADLPRMVRVFLSLANVWCDA